MHIGLISIGRSGRDPTLKQHLVFIWTCLAGAAAWTSQLQIARSIRPWLVRNVLLPVRAPVTVSVARSVRASTVAAAEGQYLKRTIAPTAGLTASAW